MNKVIAFSKIFSEMENIGFYLLSPLTSPVRRVFQCGDMRYWKKCSAQCWSFYLGAEIWITKRSLRHLTILVNAVLPS